MAKQGFGLRHYGSSSSSGSASQTLAAALSSYHDDVLNRYLPTSVPPVDRSNSGAVAGDDPDYYPYPYNSSWLSSSPVQESLFPSSSKRSSRVIYPQTMYGAHNTLGQTDAWYSSNALSKRPKFASVSEFPIYPQRPGEKDCAHYMLTRTCKFGDSCKFDHPVWVPDGGIPDWKEVPNINANGTLPERLGHPDCPYYLKTQTCKYGSNCKFNHPKEIATDLALPSSALPERPTEPLCSFYMKTGKCKFGAMCRFHHPKDIRIASSDIMSNQEEPLLPEFGALKSSPHNSKGLPLRQGEVDCPFYMKTGSCKYGSNCRYNHPNRNGLNAPTTTLDFAALASLAATYNTRHMDPTPLYNPRPIDPVSSLYKALDPIFNRSTAVSVPSNYPQRPGQIECDYYMKTGECKFGERCKFHHPVDRFVPVAKETQRSSVKLTLAGLPRREDAARCPFYMKTGACKYGANCKFDHPPPGEVISDAATQSVGVQDHPEG